MKKPANVFEKGGRKRQNQASGAMGKRGALAAGKEKKQSGAVKKP